IRPRPLVGALGDRTDPLPADRVTDLSYSGGRHARCVQQEEEAEHTGGEEGDAAGGGGTEGLGRGSALEALRDGVDEFVGPLGKVQLPGQLAVALRLLQVGGGARRGRLER